MKNQHFSLRSRSLLRSATEVNFVVLACCKSRQFKVINRKGVTLRVSPFLLFLFELFDVVGKSSEVGRGVFVLWVGYHFLPLSEFFRVFHVGFCVC